MPSASPNIPAAIDMNLAESMQQEEEGEEEGTAAAPVFKVVQQRLLALT